MQRKSVVSSNVVSIGYSLDEQMLEVEFKGGAVYQYLAVPEHIGVQVMTSPSIGKAVNVVAKANFKTVKVS